MPARIYLVEDHPAVRQGLRSIIDDLENTTVCGETGSTKTARREIPEMTPDLALIDLFLTDGSGLDLIKNLSTQLDLPVLVVSAHDETLYARRALEAGARGYLMKDVETQTLANAIRQVLNGSIYLSSEMTSALLSDYVDTSSSPESVIDSLSDQELQVFTLLGNGLERLTIAETLSVSPKTVDTYQEHLKEKLSLQSTAKLRRAAALWVENERTEG